MGLLVLDSRVRLHLDMRLEIRAKDSTVSSGERGSWGRLLAPGGQW